MYLSDIDLKRLHGVQEGILKGRGVGKTTTKLVKFLGYINIHNEGHRFMYVVGSRGEMDRLYRQFHLWMMEVGVIVRNSNYSQHTFEVMVNKPVIVKTWFEKIIHWVAPPAKKDEKIYLEFAVISSHIETRGCGKRYRTILFDITDELKRKFAQQILKLQPLGKAYGL